MIQTIPALFTFQIMATSTADQVKLRERYPPIEPYHFSWITVSQLHTIYYEQCGNPNGIPVLVL